jgi:DNA topoisomerase-1
MTGSTVTARAVRRAVRLHDDPEASAAAAGLRYVCDSDPGFRRVRHGRGFSFRDSRGRPPSPVQLDRIRALVIPPAWQDVWICRSADGHLQATGVDEAGRKQYLYHPHWRELRDGLTFDRLAVMGAVLPDLRSAVAAQLRRRTVDRDRLLAGMVRVLDATGIRVGNEVYERDNDSVGLTTLRWAHVAVRGAIVALAFPAKSGRRASVVVHDRSLARLLAAVGGGPRRRVFRVGGRPLKPDELNAYLASATGEHVTAKDFRTWRGTVTALTFLRTLPAGGRPTKRNALAALDAAADSLGNTRAVARAHYVHPGLIDAYLAGGLEYLPEPDPAPGLDPDERALLDILPRLVENR